MIIVSSMITVWGVRLFWHIFQRNKNKDEDYRYKKWRESWGRLFYIRSYLQVFILQGVLLYIIILPALLINREGGEGISYFTIVGVLIWAVGFFFEVIGDAQLARFLKDKKNKGKLMEEGLWKYTRHPNYFGEVLCWWGIFIVAVPVTGGLLSIVSPLTITFLIFKVSGIPLLERKMAEHPDFEEYSKRVSIFIPLPPKKSK